MTARLVHCSYHKCLTVYFGKTLSTLYNRVLIHSRGYRHFNSLVDEFYEQAAQFRICSVNNQFLDLAKLGADTRITRFVRDPRDLVVSGYFYHKRGAEPWCNVRDPRPEDWAKVNGCIPEAMPAGHSLSSFLGSVDQDDGLIAEIEFRRNHFRSMEQWPLDDPRIKLFRYEDVLGNEAKTFKEILAHYRVPWIERRLGAMLASRYSLKSSRSIRKHIRNPNSGQWRKHFSPRVRDYFDQQFGGLLERYGYE